MWRPGNRLTDTGHGQKLWPVFALLIAVVVLPTAGVLWFMSQAMQSEQQAVRQRLTEIYRSRLQSTAGRIQAIWQDKISLLQQAGLQGTKPEAFASLAKRGNADSALLYENGQLLYPNASVASGISAEFATSPWLEARRLEYEKSDPIAAAEAYGKILRQSAGAPESAMALLAQARSLNKAGRTQAAIALLINNFAGSQYRNSADAQGRLILPNALLFALELMNGPSHPRFQKTAAFLVELANDYQAPAMPSSQRRFLMQQLKGIWPECPPFPTLAAEDLAAKFGEMDSDRFKPSRMQPTSIRGVWAYQTQGKSLVALFRQDRLLASMNATIAAQEPVPGVRIFVLPPGSAEKPFMTAEIGDIFPSWQLSLNLEGSDPFKSVTGKKFSMYLWTGILMTAGIVVLSILLAGYLRRQMRLTRLKNDLIATVSHELKTPLASMRLLVDTLRDGHYQDTQMVQEYLGMISKENARLSSLIEEFLTFSRMERNKSKFDKSILKTGDIVHAALEAVGDRLQAPGCDLTLELAPQLPDVIGDHDALVTVVVNLLDNAIKYSGDEKKIYLRGYGLNGNVCLEVQDNGIGFPQSEAEKIFDRFYQVDTTLSRQTGGCGLGLSIVKFIVAAHNGSVTAQSQPGKGSTFTVQLPAAG